MVNNFTSSTYGLQLISRPQSTALSIAPEGFPMLPYIQNLCSTEIRAQLLMVMSLLVCVRGKGTRTFMVFKAGGLSESENKRFQRCNSCPHGTIWCLVYFKAWSALRQSAAPWLNSSPPLHYPVTTAFKLWLYFPLSTFKPHGPNCGRCSTIEETLESK